MTLVTTATLLDFIQTELELETKDADETTSLIGGKALVDSMGLVQICLHLEECAESENFVFDWASEKAMSENNSMFRTIGDLLREYFRQKDEARL